MKTINRKDFQTVGSVAKLHGHQGEIKIHVTHSYKPKKWAFLEIREKPVPFLVESLKKLNEDMMVIKLKGVDGEEAASALLGLTLLEPKTKSNQQPAELEMDLIGYQLVDETIGEIGVVERMEEMPMQLLIRTTYLGKEVLIPAVEPLVVSIDFEVRIIYLDLPEGLIELE